MASADAVPIVPGFEAPKGNWIARNLRLINENSKQLFPESSQGDRRHRGEKFHTLYKVDYHDYPEECFIEGLMEKGKEPKRETIRDVLFGNSPSEVFQDWKVPARLVPEVAATERDSLAFQAVVTGRREKQAAKRPALSRQATLPAIPGSRERRLIHPPPVTGLVKSRTTIDGSDLRGTKDRLRDTLQPHTVNAADKWLKTAPKADKKVIEKVLRMQEKKHQLDHALRKSLQPDARKDVEEWLEAANESERQVALKFFTSVAGAKLMGSTQEEQKGRLQQVIKTLESHKATGGAAPKTDRQSVGTPRESKLKFVNLLDDQTRANRWMYTTWHHLPEYRNDDPVNNWSSHYTRPHAPTPRHFVIHPDWG